MKKMILSISVASALLATFSASAQNQMPSNQAQSLQAQQMQAMQQMGLPAGDIAQIQQLQQQAAQQQAAQQPSQNAFYPDQPAQVAPASLPPSSLPPLPSDVQRGLSQLDLSPNEIREVRQNADERQRAMLELPDPPKSVTGSISLSLDPGSSPSVIRPYYGIATSLVVLDSTGAPWPVENFMVGNGRAFQVDRLDGEKGSSFVVNTSQIAGQSNLILKLVGHPTPVVINLIAGQKTHDARVEARVLGRGPNAVVNSVALTPGVDGRLLSVLDGVPPSGRALQISGDSSSKAWVMPDGNVWLRTSLQVVSPAPLSFVSSSDGTKVYRLAPTSRVLGMIEGQFLTLELNGCLQECGNNSIGW